MLDRKKTEICISISSSPGSFGETVHNRAYSYHKLNYLYKAIKAVDLKRTIDSVRDLSIKGCSVSMPFKEKVIKYLDKVEPLAKKTGAVNTILNIGVGTDLTINELAYKISKLAGFSGKIIHDLNMPDGTPQKMLDVTLINNMGWKAKTSLKEGLTKTYNDFCKRYKI